MYCTWIEHHHTQSFCICYRDSWKEHICYAPCVHMIFSKKWIHCWWGMKVSLKIGELYSAQACCEWTDPFGKLLSMKMRTWLGNSCHRKCAFLKVAVCDGRESCRKIASEGKLWNIAKVWHWDAHSYLWLSPAERINEILCKNGLSNFLNTSLL